MRPKTPQDYEKLKAELKTPFLGLRRFIYLACGASGSVGAYIFLTQLLAGRGETTTTLNNLAVQMGVIGLMILLYRIDRPKI
jgi:Low psii accumulation1 / Rep27